MSYIIFNDMLKTEHFLDYLKFADITKVFKRRNSLHKLNYRAVSVLPTLSNFFEKVMQKQVSGYTSSYSPPYMIWRTAVEGGRLSL